MRNGLPPQPRTGGQRDEAGAKGGPKEGRVRAEGGEGAAGPNDVEGKISKVYRREGV